MCRAVRHTTVVLAHVRILSSLPHGRYLLRSVVKVVLEREINRYWIDRYLFKYYSLVVVITWKYRHITIIEAGSTFSYAEDNYIDESFQIYNSFQIE